MQLNTFTSVNEAVLDSENIGIKPFYYFGVFILRLRPRTYERVCKGNFGTDCMSSSHPHVLIHTFASHFVMNGGNILTLQKILGHQSIAMTMRYAHLAPDHLKAATKLNPITALKV